jgi:hypothetical protein
MAVSDDILAARHYGVVRCGLSVHPSPTVAELAREFGLRDDPECYREIDGASARASVLRLLHRDMAYDAEIMPMDRAGQLADRFFSQFGDGSRYFTNNWCPVTDATFDEGILVLGQHRSGCLWVEDED